MREEWARTALLLGAEGMEKLAGARVAVFGLGGVGGCAAEALARSGIGTLDLIDSDRVSRSNLNRQIIATQRTIGAYKTDAAAARIHDINPQAVLHTHTVFYTPETQSLFDFTQYDYVIDAIDTISGKIALVMQAQAAGTPIICSMGAGNKLDPTAFEVADIYQTSVCPLARVMRRELRARGVKKLKVVYSREEARTPLPSDETPPEGRRQIPGSVSFVPTVAGFILAGEVVRDLAGVPPRR